ncbi:hypothetical protein, partial [Salinispira pacifica]
MGTQFKRIVIPDRSNGVISARAGRAPRNHLNEGQCREAPNPHRLNLIQIVHRDQANLLIHLERQRVYRQRPVCVHAPDLAAAGCCKRPERMVDRESLTGARRKFARKRRTFR